MYELEVFRAPMHQPDAHAMERLQIELIVGLDGNEAHVLAGHHFGDRFGIEEAGRISVQHPPVRSVQSM